MTKLPIESILQAETLDLHRPPGETIGESREGRSIEAFALGRGPTAVSLIGGCHADEPVGPAMLQRLVRFLSSHDPVHPLLADYRWRIVPHVNPDGAMRNAGWSNQVQQSIDHLGESDLSYDPVLYVQNVIRELPGDDIEFGFPRDAEDREARPENRAVASFLSAEGPVDLHASFHGMGFAPGPWFLIESSWTDRTSVMRQALRDRVRQMGYPLFDIDRQGEKGFFRIDEGFSTRPDSRAMVSHFLAQDDEETAAKFRPSSMELAQSLGGDPLTFVSEMPLFLLPEEPSGPTGSGFKAGTAARRQLHDQLNRLAVALPADEARTEMTRLEVRPMPIRDQMRLQLAFLNQALGCIAAH